MKIETIEEFKEALMNCYKDEMAVRYAMDFNGLLKSGYIRIMTFFTES